VTLRWTLPPKRSARLAKRGKAQKHANVATSGAEFFGTFWLTFAGCGSAVLAAGFPSLGQLWLFWLAPILGASIAGVISRWQHDEPDA
jgi:glycerol uptake facilitator-like aquaporin